MSVPPVDMALAPAAVRNGGPAAQHAYESALDFESMLVQQLSQSLLTGGESAEGEGEGGGETADPQLSSMLPQALTEGVMSHGGLGMAQQLLPALGHATPVVRLSAAGGSPAPAGLAVKAATALAPSGGVAP